MTHCSYEIVNLEDVLSDMCDLLTNEELQPSAHLADVTLPEMRMFWMEFSLLHLANAAGVEPHDLKSGDTVQADAFIDAYGQSLTFQLTDRDFRTIAQMKLGKFGAHFMLPTLAGLISPDLKAEVLGELEEGVKQLHSL